MFDNVEEAIENIRRFDMDPNLNMTFQKFEIYIEFSNGDKISGVFNDKENAINFLNIST